MVERVDMTFMGYFVMGLSLLVFGVIGLQDGGLFGVIDVTSKDPANFPLSWMMVSTFAAIIGVAMALVTIFTYRVGNKNATAIFAAYSAAMFTYVFMSIGHELFNTMSKEGMVFNSTSWFVLIMVAVVFFVLAFYFHADGAPRFEILLSSIIGLMFVFLALAYYAFGVAAEVDGTTQTWGVVFGIFAFIGFFVSSYIGLAYAAPRANLPFH